MKKFANALGHWATIQEVKIDGETWYELKTKTGNSLDCSYYKSEESATNRLHDLICWNEIDGE